jgi:hypothetical protein
MMKRLLTVFLLCVSVITLSGCLATGRQCRSYDYCLERDGPRQYVRAPDGWGGKYCQANPENC